MPDDMVKREIRIVFDGPPGPQAGRFVEVEDEAGRSFNAGEWRKRGDGCWELVLAVSPDRLLALGGDPPPRPVRRRLPDERQSITHRFNVGGAEGYVTVGLYPDGSPGEVFVKIAKEGSTLSGLIDAWAIAVSMALQHGVPFEALAEKFTGMSFEPCGHTGGDFGFARSLLDYLARWMSARFGDAARRASVPPPAPTCGEK